MNIEFWILCRGTVDNRHNSEEAEKYFSSVQVTPAEINWLSFISSALVSVNELTGKSLKAGEKVLNSVDSYYGTYLYIVVENSIRDARTPQPGKIVFNTMRYRSSETVHRLGYFQSSVSVQIMFKWRK